MTDTSDRPEPDNEPEDDPGKERIKLMVHLACAEANGEPTVTVTTSALRALANQTRSQRKEIQRTREEADRKATERAELVDWLKKYRRALQEIVIRTAADLGIDHPVVARIGAHLVELDGPGNPLYIIEFAESLYRRRRLQLVTDYYNFAVSVGIQQSPLSSFLGMPPQPREPQPPATPRNEPTDG